MKFVVVGFGLVGSKIVDQLERRGYGPDTITILVQREREVESGRFAYHARKISSGDFDGAQIAFFAGTEGEKGASKVYAYEAIKRGCIVIDNGDDFRMDPSVPLVIPEINPSAILGHSGLIANPNCSTIIALMALAPLHKVATIQRIVACTYQAVSGAGGAGISQLNSEIEDSFSGNIEIFGGDKSTKVFPHTIFGNVIPQIGSYIEETGEFSEEAKMRRETQKILQDTSIRVSATCVRVPVINGHSIALHVEFERDITPEEARDALTKALHVKVNDDPKHSGYPTPEGCNPKNVHVGRIRRDTSVTHGLSLWCVGDNVGKGAAINAVQIAGLLSLA